MRVYDRCKVCDFTKWMHDEGAVNHRFVSPRHKEKHEKRRAVLKDWNIVRQYADNRKLSHALEGLVYGHDSFGDGSFVTTSPLLRLDIPAREAETLNTVYLLG